jgi:hypothetical protein
VKKHHGVRQRMFSHKMTTSRLRHRPFDKKCFLKTEKVQSLANQT